MSEAAASGMVAPLRGVRGPSGRRGLGGSGR